MDSAGTQRPSVPFSNWSGLDPRGSRTISPVRSKGVDGVSPNVSPARRRSSSRSPSTAKEPTPQLTSSPSKRKLQKPTETEAEQSIRLTTSCRDTVLKQPHRVSNDHEATLQALQLKAQSLKEVGKALLDELDPDDANAQDRAHHQLEHRINQTTLRVVANPIRHEALREKLAINYGSNFLQIQDVIGNTDADFIPGRTTGETVEDVEERRLMEESILRIRQHLKATLSFRSNAPRKSIDGPELRFERRSPILEAYRRAMEAEKAAQTQRLEVTNIRPIVDAKMRQDQERRTEIRKIIAEADHPGKLVPLIWQLADKLHQEEARVLFGYLHVERQNLKWHFLHEELVNLRGDTKSGNYGDLRKLRHEVDILEEEREWLYHRMKLLDARVEATDEKRAEADSRYHQSLEDSTQKLRSQNIILRMQMSKKKRLIQALIRRMGRIENQAMLEEDNQKSLIRQYDVLREKYLASLSVRENSADATNAAASELDALLKSRRHYLIKNSVILRVSMERMKIDRGEFVRDVLKQSGVLRSTEAVRDDFVSFIEKGHAAMLQCFADLYTTVVEDLGPFIDADLATKWTNKEDPVIVLVAQRLSLPNPYSLYVAASEVLRSNWEEVKEAFIAAGKGVFSKFAAALQELTERKEREEELLEERRNLNSRISELLGEVTAAKRAVRELAEKGLRGMDLAKAALDLQEKLEPPPPPEEQISTDTNEVTGAEYKKLAQKYNDMVSRVNHVQSGEREKVTKIIQLEGHLKQAWEEKAMLLKKVSDLQALLTKMPPSSSSGGAGGGSLSNASFSGSPDAASPTKGGGRGTAGRKGPSFTAAAAEMLKKKTPLIPPGRETGRRLDSARSSMNYETSSMAEGRRDSARSKAEPPSGRSSPASTSQPQSPSHSPVAKAPTPTAAPSSQTKDKNDAEAKSRKPSKTGVPPPLSTSTLEASMENPLGAAQPAQTVGGGAASGGSGSREPSPGDGLTPPVPGLLRTTDSSKRNSLHGSDSQLIGMDSSHGGLLDASEETGGGRRKRESVVSLSEDVEEVRAHRRSVVALVSAHCQTDAVIIHQVDANSADELTSRRTSNVSADVLLETRTYSQFTPGGPLRADSVIIPSKPTTATQETQTVRPLLESEGTQTPAAVSASVGVATQQVEMLSAGVQAASSLTAAVNTMKKSFAELCAEVGVQVSAEMTTEEIQSILWSGTQTPTSGSRPESAEPTYVSAGAPPPVDTATPIGRPLSAVLLRPPSLPSLQNLSRSIMNIEETAEVLEEAITSVRDSVGVSHESTSGVPRPAGLPLVRSTSAKMEKGSGKTTPKKSPRHRAQSVVTPKSGLGGRGRRSPSSGSLTPATPPLRPPSAHFASSIDDLNTQLALPGTGIPTAAELSVTAPEDVTRDQEISCHLLTDSILQQQLDHRVNEAVQVALQELKSKQEASAGQHSQFLNVGLIATPSVVTRAQAVQTDDVSVMDSGVGNTPTIQTPLRSPFSGRPGSSSMQLPPSIGAGSRPGTSNALLASSARFSSAGMRSGTQSEVDSEAVLTDDDEQESTNPQPRAGGLGRSLSSSGNKGPVKLSTADVPPLRSAGDADVRSSIAKKELGEDQPELGRTFRSDQSEAGDLGFVPQEGIRFGARDQPTPLGLGSKPVETVGASATAPRNESPSSVPSKPPLANTMRASTPTPTKTRTPTASTSPTPQRKGSGQAHQPDLHGLSLPSPSMQPVTAGFSSHPVKLIDDIEPVELQSGYAQLSLNMVALHRALKRLFDQVSEALHLPVEYTEPLLATEVYNSIRSAAKLEERRQAQIAEFMAEGMSEEEAIAEWFASSEEAREEIGLSLSQVAHFARLAAGSDRILSVKLRDDLELKLARIKAQQEKEREFQLRATRLAKMRDGKSVGTSSADDDAPMIMHLSSLHHLKELGPIRRANGATPGEVGVGGRSVATPPPLSQNRPTGSTPTKPQRLRQEIGSATAQHHQSQGSHLVAFGGGGFKRTMASPPQLRPTTAVAVLHQHSPGHPPLDRRPNSPPRSQSPVPSAAPQIN